VAVRETLECDPFICILKTQRFVLSVLYL